MRGKYVQPLLVVCSILGCLLAVELGVRLYDSYGNGDRRPLSDRIAAEASFTNKSLATYLGPGCYWVDHLVPHPYLNYVKHPFPPCNSRGTGPSGFSGPEYPTRREPGTFVILLTGGSVAEAHAGFTPNSNFLEKELNAHYLGHGIKRYRVLPAAAGGWKQPQQFIAFALASDIVDGVVTLDGYNEFVSIFQSGPSPYFEYPIASLLPNGPGGYFDLSTLALEWADGVIQREQINSPLFRHSHLAYDGAERVLNRIRVALRARRSRSSGIPFHPLGLDVGPIEAKTPERNIGRYLRYIRMMNAISLKFGIRELHAIQPTPAVDKPLTEQELKVVGNLNYAQEYRRLATAVNSLSSERIPVCDLLRVFQDDHRSLYMDYVHVIREGHEAINAALVRCLEKSWGLKRSS